MYPTRDTSLASYLLVRGYPLVSIDYSEEIYYMHFGNGNTDEEALQQDVTQYYAHQGLIDAQAIQRIHKMLVGTLRKKEQWGGIGA
jgi:hypothetical protein